MPAKPMTDAPLVILVGLIVAWCGAHAAFSVALKQDVPEHRWR
jgi:hypothetical protein